MLSTYIFHFCSGCSPCLTSSCCFGQPDAASRWTAGRIRWCGVVQDSQCSHCHRERGRGSSKRPCNWGTMGGEAPRGNGDIHRPVDRWDAAMRCHVASRGRWKLLESAFCCYMKCDWRFGCGERLGECAERGSGRWEAPVLLPPYMAVHLGEWWPTALRSCQTTRQPFAIHALLASGFGQSRHQPGSAWVWWTPCMWWDSTLCHHT